MLVIGKDTAVLAGDGPQVWSTADGSTWTNERFYGVGAEPVEGSGVVTELVDVQGVLWARYRPDGDIGFDVSILVGAKLISRPGVERADEVGSLDKLLDAYTELLGEHWIAFLGQVIEMMIDNA